MSDRDEITDALRRYEDMESAWGPMRADGLADARFALLGEQWPQEIINDRMRDGRPTLTLNHMMKFIRQVVNDARQNKPQVVIRPMDSGADIQTAEILGGLIKQIEGASDADVAYDTAIQNAVTSGVGFWRIDIDDSCNDTFDNDLVIRRIANPFSVLFDPLTMAADASDWRDAFIYDDMTKSEFERQYPGADTVGFDGDPYAEQWFSEDCIRLAEYWEREEVMREIYKLSNDEVVGEDFLSDESNMAALQLAGITIVGNRQVKSYKITHRLMSGAETLEKNNWPGTLIPIVPCYGEEFNIEGRRYFRSLIHYGKDAQRNFNYWRSAGTELIALAPKVPWVGPKGFVGTGTMAEKWGNANTESHAYLEYENGKQPTKADFAGVPAGVLQEANLAGDDMREIIGVNNAALGVPNPRQESGVALKQRRTEADTGTMHFADNQMRAVRYGARVLLEMIPKVYNSARVVRVLGKDGKDKLTPVNQPILGPDGIPLLRDDGTVRSFDLTVGKYDVAVDVGPAYTTRRQEAADMITSFIQAAPQVAPILGPMLAKMSDWPEAEKVSQMLATAMPPAARAVFDGTPPPPPTPPPEVMLAQETAKAQIAIDGQKAQNQFQIEQQKAQNDAVLEQQKAASQRDREMAQAQADIAVSQQKAANDMQIERERAALKFQLMREEAALNAELEILRVKQQAASPQEE